METKMLLKNGIKLFAFFVVSLMMCVEALAGNEDCLMCHSDKSLTMTRKGKSVPLFVDASQYKNSSHGEMECTACHEGFKPFDLPHAKKIKPVDCFGCHGGNGLDHYNGSVHGKKNAKGDRNANCSDCHTTHAIKKVSALGQSERSILSEQTCARCHPKVHTRFSDSDHGRALAAGVKGAPACIDCHTSHEVQSPFTDDSPTSRIQEAATCLKCHLDNPDVRAKVGPSAGFVASYEKSVHGLALHEGNTGAATCSDCHGSHEMMKGSNPASHVHKTRIAETCGHCHGDIQMQFDESIHGTALARGVMASPTCTDCHGEHEIISPKDARSPVAAKNVSFKVCSPCHASLKLTQKYGLAGNRFASFEDSYHGLASKAGAVEVANCASCHGIHDIKKSTDPTSRTNKANLVETCGACHPGANENFAKGSVHVIAAEGDDDILYIVATIYIILIIGTIGGMLFHNILDFIKKSQIQLMYRRHLIERKHHGTRMYVRMTKNERIQHGTLAVSFIILVITGFALRFPDAWWVVPVRDISPWMFEIRSLAHRIAGVLMILVSLYHIYYIFAVPRGKELVRDLLPRIKDATDLIGAFKYYFGLSETKPKFSRFSYIEKAEYWALIWGTIVMVVTGFILWFDNTFMGLLTKLGWDVARTIHYYEAWLATLAIVVWHFYFISFNPDVYPLNLAFWKGTLTEEEMDDEHPLELEEILEKERKEGKSEVETIIVE